MTRRLLLHLSDARGSRVGPGPAALPGWPCVLFGCRRLTAPRRARSERSPPRAPLRQTQRMVPLDWDERLTTAPLRWKQGRQTLLEVFANAVPPRELGAEHVRTRLAQRLREQPALIVQWQPYSYDKRASPEPYLDGLEVDVR